MSTKKELAEKALQEHYRQVGGAWSKRDKTTRNILLWGLIPVAVGAYIYLETPEHSLWIFVLPIIWIGFLIKHFLKPSPHTYEFSDWQKPFKEYLKEEKISALNPPFEDYDAELDELDTIDTERYLYNGYAKVKGQKSRISITLDDNDKFVLTKLHDDENEDESVESYK